MILPSDLAFSTNDGGKTFTRRAFGFEAQTSSMAEDSTSDGFGAFHTGLIFTLPKAVGTDSFKTYISAAWIRLRHLAPTIAIRSCLVPDYRYATRFVYQVPADIHDVNEWANETIKFDEKTLSMHDRESVLYDDYWKTSENRYTHELVVAQDPDVGGRKWQILLHACHPGIDARGSMQLYEILLDYLSEYIVEHKSVEEAVVGLEWGEEVVRLPPAAALAAVRTAGLDESVLTRLPEPSAAPSVPGPVLFIRPAPVLEAEPKSSTTTEDLVLTEEETIRVRKACRAHGYTVTQFLVAVKCISEVEWAIEQAIGQESLLEATMKAYSEASHIPSVWNIVDQRYRLGEYKSHKESLHGSPGMAGDGFPFALAMDPIRRVVKYDSHSKVIRRDASDDVFWNGVVRTSQEAWRSEQTDLPAYIAREVERTVAAKDFASETYMFPAVLSSSVGDLDAMGLAKAYSPTMSASGRERITIDEFYLGVRCPTPLKMVFFWQWDHRLTIRPLSSAKYTTKEGMLSFNRIFKSWIEAVC